MKELALHIEVTQSLLEFETLKDNEISAEWEQSLINRINKSKLHSLSRLSLNMFVVTILIILFNLSFILNILIHNSPASSSHQRDLQMISKDFLINPVSLNK